MCPYTVRGVSIQIMQSEYKVEKCAMCPYMTMLGTNGMSWCVQTKRWNVSIPCVQLGNIVKAVCIQGLYGGGGCPYKYW